MLEYSGNNFEEDINMNKKMKISLCTMMVATMVAGVLGISTTVQAKVDKENVKFSKMVVFGDSYSDNGSAFEISTAVLEAGTEGAFIKPGELYWENRYSNGKTAVEVAAERQGLELTNYATGGATSGAMNYTAWMDSLGDSGVHGQIEKYKKSLNNEKPSEDTLHFILSGTNDYCMYTDYNQEGTVAQVAVRVARNTEQSIRELAALGAKNILVSEIHDVAMMPYEITEGRGETAKVFAEVANAVLEDKLEGLEEELNINIETFEITEVTDAIVENPSEYGFKHHIEVIQPTWPEVLPAKTEELESYMFMDEWHPSAALHRVLGEAIAEEIQEMQN